MDDGLAPMVRQWVRTHREGHITEAELAIELAALMDVDIRCEMGACPHTPTLPLPGDLYDGGRVVASVWVGLDDATALILTLLPQSPYYRVIDLAWRHVEWATTYWTEHLNIVPAVREYEERGGER